MALKGQLSDFNLADILQLIASQQKSGFLILEAQREMVFVFDKGVLVSTRDRRSESPDPLEIFLRAYGFFDDNQWRHVEYIKTNSSLDLTEILVSEQLLDETTLSQVLRSVAQEMAHRGMKLRRGRYHFTATKDSPPGVRGRFRMDVQALLMEAARRTDEEPLLLEAMPSQAITFEQGPETPVADALSPDGRRIMELALAGYPLGRIIRSGRADSFTVRELLHRFCQQGWLAIHESTDDLVTVGAGEGGERRQRRRHQLRSLPLTLLAVAALLAFGGLRWAPLAGDEPFGLTAPVAVGDAGTVPDPATAWLAPSRLASRDLRLRQLQAEVVESLELFQSRHGKYPHDLVELASHGLLADHTRRTVAGLGWSYELTDGGRGFRLAT
ncbi:MAG: DUF4388 domain-containing protein [Candidatus Krumholzibacteriia bacterium]